jgi:hypothetical protein
VTSLSPGVAFISILLRTPSSERAPRRRPPEGAKVPSACLCGTPRTNAWAGSPHDVESAFLPGQRAICRSDQAMSTREASFLGRPPAVSCHTSAIRRTPSTSSVSDLANGIRSHESRPPSTANAGPGDR